MMYSDLIKYLLPVVSMFSVVPLVFLILYKKLYKEEILLWFLIYLIAKFIFDFISNYLASQKLNSLVNENFSLTVCTIIIIHIFALVLKNITRYIVLLYCIVGILCLLDDSYTNYNLNSQEAQALSFSYTLCSAVIIVLCCVVFYKLVKNPVVNLFNYPVFYICSGLILIHSSSVFLSILYNVSFRWGNNDEIILYIPYIFEILSSVIISFGFYKYRK